MSAFLLFVILLDKAMASERLFWLLVAAVLHSALSFAHYDHTVYVDCSNTNATDNATCGSHTHPCRTFSYAVSERVLNSTQVVVSSGDYSLNHTISLSGLTNIALTGVDPFVNGSSQAVVTVTCESGAGLSFVQSSGITIQNVHFCGCGALQNSTSRNFSDHSFSFMQFPVGVYFLFCQHINLTGVSVTNSTGTGMAVYATGGLNYIHNCTFLENKPSRFGGGGLYVEFPYCSPTNQTGCTTIQDNEYNSNASYTISESLFSGNVALEPEASIHESQYNFLPLDPHYHNTAGHGGGIALYLCRANDIVISLTECKIEHNKAYFGGGIVVSFEEYSVDTRVNIVSSTISDNHCVYRSAFGGSGGGMMVLFKFSYQASHTHNSMSVSHSHFTKNTAYFGGGSVVKASPEMEQTDPTNSVYFNECVWSGNYGTVGAALLASAYNISAKRGALLKPVFESCTFENNTGDIPGIVTADYLPIAFSTNVKFFHNGNSSQASSPLTIDQTSVDFLENCQATFHHNKAAYGGAISLHGHAFMTVHRNTSLTFSHNYAQRAGGAIYQNPTSTGLLSNGHCFVQYMDGSVHPKDWETNFVFDFNRENVHTSDPECNAMVLGSLIPCIWNGYTYSRSQNETVLSKVFCKDRNNWTFRSNSTNCGCSNQTRTLPNRIMANISLNVIPGLRSPLNITLLDDYSKNVTKYAVLNVWPATNSSISLPPNSFYITDNSLVMYGESMNNGTLDVDTLPPRHLFASVPVHFQQCPPGFVQTNKDGHRPTYSSVDLSQNVRELAKCVCDESYGGRVKCSEAAFTAKLQRGLWMGVDPSLGGDLSKQLLVCISPYTASAMDSQYVELPNNTADLDKLLCQPVGREGIMCGRCRQGYGLAVNTKQIQCVRCSDNQAYYMWVFYILSQLLPITIMFLIFVLLNVSTTTGPANAFILFAQLLTTALDIEGDGTVHVDSITSHYDALEQAYIIPYDIWNLNFFFFPPTCLSPYLSTQAFLSLDFLVAAYPLILIFLFYGVVSLYNRGIQPVYCLCRPVHNLFARFQHKWNLQHSTIDAFATFLVLSYNKFTATSVYLLTPEPLVDSSGNGVTNVLYLDGNVHFLSNEHLPYFFLALCILLTIVILPPLLLLVYPLRLIQRLSNWFGCRRACCQINTGGRMQMFLDTFQGCFKDGTNGTRDYRYFAGVYFILRILFFTLYAYSNTWIQQFFVQQLLCTAAVLLFAVFRPYKKDFYNNLDATIFGVLALINAVSMYNICFTSLDQPLSKWAFAMQYILIFLPLMYMVAYVMRAVVRNNKQKLKKCFKKVFRFSSTDENTPILTNQRDEGTLDAEFLAFAAAIDDQSHQVICVTPPRGHNTGRNSGPQGAGLDVSTSTTSSHGTTSSTDLYCERGEGGRRPESEHKTDNLREGEEQSIGRGGDSGKRGGNRGHEARKDGELSPSGSGHNQNKDGKSTDEDP